MIYEYKCRSHGQFERAEPMLQEHRATCPTCTRPATRVYSLSGWYYDHPKPLFYADGSYEEK